MSAVTVTEANLVVTFFVISLLIIVVKISNLPLIPTCLVVVTVVSSKLVIDTDPKEFSFLSSINLTLALIVCSESIKNVASPNIFKFIVTWFWWSKIMVKHF